MNVAHLYGLVKGFLLVYIVSFLAIEFVINRLVIRAVDLRSFRINIASGVIVLATRAVVQHALFNGVYLYLYIHRLLHIQSTALAFVFCFFAYTLLQYCSHRLSHEVRLFWCFHEVHHSSTSMDSSAGLRNSVFDILSTDALYFLIPLLGIHPLIYFTVYALAKIWGTFIHISDRLVCDLPLINRVVVDPRTHHLHHASNKIYHDKNFCETIVLYDKMFGTYIRETEKPVYGSTGNPQPGGFWNVQLNEFRLLAADLRSTRRTRTRLGYLFNRPGWKPRGA